MSWQTTSNLLPDKLTIHQSLNSLAPGRSECDSKNGIFYLVLLIGIFRSHDNALRWMPQDLTDDKSTLVQVTAWCHQATSHYLSHCWLSPLSPYGITRPQWVNVALPRRGSSQYKRCCLTRKGIPVVKTLRQFDVHLIFIIRNPCAMKDVLYIETRPRIQ